jgi:hypothetical protein
MDRILREGLCWGDVPIRFEAPLYDTNAVWLTELPEPAGCGLGEARELTETDRLTHLRAFGEMPPPGSRYADKRAVRISVVIPIRDRRLKRWVAYGRKHCELGVYDALIAADGHSHEHWWLYFGTILPQEFKAVDYLKPITPLS